MKNITNITNISYNSLFIDISVDDKGLYYLTIRNEDCVNHYAIIHKAYIFHNMDQAIEYGKQWINKNRQNAICFAS